MYNCIIYFRMFCLFLNYFLFKKFYFFLYKKNLKNLNFNLNHFNNNFIFSLNFNRSLILLKYIDIDSNFKKFFFINKNKIKNFLKIFNFNFNFILIDSFYKNIVPLYNYMFGFKNIYYNKNFFLLNKKNITLNNWVYFYKFFLFKFNINLIIVLNMNFFIKFLFFLKNLNVCLFSLSNKKINNINCDYYILFSFSSFNFYKFYFYNYICFLFFKNLNNKKIDNCYYFYKNITLIKNL